MEFIPHYMYRCSSSALSSFLFSICKESAKVLCSRSSRLLFLLPTVALITVVIVLHSRSQSLLFGLHTHLQLWLAREAFYPHLCGRQVVMGVLLRFVLLDLPPLWARHSCPQQLIQLRKMTTQCTPPNMLCDEMVGHKRPTAGHLDTKE